MTNALAKIGRQDLAEVDPANNPDFQEAAAFIHEAACLTDDYERAAKVSLAHIVDGGTGRDLLFTWPLKRDDENHSFDVAKRAWNRAFATLRACAGGPERFLLVAINEENDQRAQHTFVLVPALKALFGGQSEPATENGQAQRFARHFEALGKVYVAGHERQLDRLEKLASRLLEVNEKQSVQLQDAYEKMMTREAATLELQMKLAKEQRDEERENKLWDWAEALVPKMVGHFVPKAKFVGFMAELSDDQIDAILELLDKSQKKTLLTAIAKGDEKEIENLIGSLQEEQATKLAFEILTEEQRTEFGKIVAEMAKKKK